MAVGKGSIQRATRALKEDNKEKAVFTEAVAEVKEEKAPAKKPAAKKAPAKKTTTKTTTTKKPATKKATPKKEEAKVAPVVEEKKETKKTYEQISRIKSDLPVHLL